MPVRPPLLLTGGPAVGKSTTARRLAELRPRGAHVDVDDVRQLVLGGHAAPWSGPEGAAQHELGVRNACALARNFLTAGIDVVITDVPTPALLSRYRHELHDALVVRLVVSWEETLRRHRRRPRWITDEELRMLHHADRDDPPAADHTLDVEALTLEAQVSAVEAIWAPSAR